MSSRDSPAQFPMSRFSPEVQPGQAIVGVTSATSPYVEQDSSGAVVAAAAAGTEQALRLVLVSLEGQWRITDVLPGS